MIFRMNNFSKNYSIEKYFDYVIYDNTVKKSFKIAVIGTK